MALQFYFGGSGAGKSRKLHEDIIEASRRGPKRNFLLIVPDQFTMQTQMDLVLEHPNRGIMNIDVLSFGRLTHRILEEVGYEDMPVLDDTGKSLILRKIAETEQQKLSVIGKHLLYSRGEIGDFGVHAVRHRHEGTFTVGGVCQKAGRAVL